MRWPLCMLMVVGAIWAAPGCEPATPPSRAGSARVAALAPGVARIVADAGAAETLVARHAFDVWSDPALAVCGDQSGIDYEALLRLRPTHVLLQWGARTLPPRLERLAREHRWTVRSYPLLSLQEVESSADEIAALLAGPGGGPAPGEQASPGERLRRALQRRGAIDPGLIGPVLLLHGISPPTALGPGSYHHQMLVSLGGAPAIPAGAPFITLDAEDLLRLAPQAIIIIQPRAPSAPPGLRDASALRVRLGRLAALDLPAIRDGRIALVDHPMALVPGTNLIDVANDMAAILEGWSGAGVPAARD